MKTPWYLVAIALVLLTISCDLLDRDKSDKVPIARVGDSYLYAEDLAELLKGAKTAADSQQVMSNFVDSWIRRQLMVKIAEEYLPPEQLDIEKSIQDYRQSLLLHAYESELIRQKLDTNVTEQVIEDYYNNNPNSFELKEDIVQFYYIKIPLQAPKIDSAKYLFKTRNEENLKKLVKYGFQYAEDFYLQDSIWFELNELYKQIPIDHDQLRTLSKNHLSGEVQDSNFLYLIRINDFKEQRELAPLNYVKDDIRKIIVNQRKIDLINNTYESVYQEAVKNGTFENYVK